MKYKVAVKIEGSYQFVSTINLVEEFIEFSPIAGEAHYFNCSRDRILDILFMNDVEMGDFRISAYCKYEDPRWIAANSSVNARGVRRWNSNGNIIPRDCLEKAGLPVSEHFEEEQREETAKVMREYKAAQARRTPEQIAEERAEARAALGPGQEMINVFTGERYIT